MSLSLPNRPKFLETALQGLVFWIGHRQALFSGYPLSEGAIVAEACNLIQANLHGQELLLFPELLYKNLVEKGRPLDGFGSTRADLVLCDAAAKDLGRENNVAAFTRIVVEVKRGSASKKSIDDDLKRLHSFLELAGPGVRCFLVVVSENRAPRRFVKDGKSILGVHRIPSSTGFFRVRRSVKAAAKFSHKETAHYGCLMEVFRRNST